MINSIKKAQDKYNSAEEFTRLVKRIIFSFLISSVAIYIYISYSNNFSLLLLADDMSYAIRSGAVIGGIGFMIVRWMEKKIN
jgi:hypothetical protein